MTALSQNTGGPAPSPHDRLIRLVERILERHADAAPIATDTRLNELGLSSMKMINLMLAIELEFDLSLPQADITPNNFESLDSVEAMLTRLLRGGGH